MSKGITRSEKRKKQSEGDFFFGLLKSSNHFFPELLEKLSEVKDPRKAGAITYRPEELLYEGLLKKAAAIPSMRQMDQAFNTKECIRNVYQVLGTKEKENLPHHDTLNDYLEKVEPSELEKVRDYMTGRLLKGRALEHYRLLGRKWVVLIDGTGLYTFSKKHCEHCLRRQLTNTRTGEKKTVYMHHVMEAKLLAGEMVISLGSEFIENESEEVEKQDCEIKAFYRLSEKLKKKYPRLGICIVGDGLYACDPVFEICRKNKWNYLIRFKEDSLPTLAEELRALRKIEGGLQKDRSESCLYANEVVARHREVNYLLKKDVGRDGKEREYVFLTDLRISKGNASELAATGRARWKIENEGFNRQKNHRCFIEHTFSKNYNAMKNHYLLAQIAEILLQLYEKGSKLLTAVKYGIKEISSLLLESIRTRALTDEDIQNLDMPIQIRFV